MASPVAHGQWYAFILKGVMTAIILAGGFRGGEVTPLFFMGATFGCAVAAGCHRLGWAVGQHADVLAGAGMIAALAGGTKAPLACALIGCELFGPLGGASFLGASGTSGWGGQPMVALAGCAAWLGACLVARGTSGRHGIYTH